MKRRLQAVVWATVFLASNLVASSSWACSWDMEWELGYYRFFNPEYNDLEDFKAFHFTFDRLYDYDLLEPVVSTQANTAAWQAHLAGVSLEDIETVVYDLGLDRLQTIREKGKDLVLDGRERSNPLIMDFVAGKRLDMLDYLILANRAEPICNMGWDPWDETERDMGDADNIIADAREFARRAKEPHLKIRANYQILRLLQYGGKFEEAIETYRQHILPLAAADPLIALWSQCHYAGCLRNLEMEPEAAYNFSRVFDLCPSRRIQAWYGWRISSDEAWDAVVAKCKDNHEKAIVHFLRAFNPNSIGTEDLEAMQSLDPGTKLLDVLLLREINKLETTVLGFRTGDEQPLRTRLMAQQGRDLAAFVNSVLASGKMHNRNVWELSSVYLRFLNGDAQGALAELEAKSKVLTGPNASKGRILAFVFKLGGLTKADASVENAILEDFQNLKTTDDQDWEDMTTFRDQALAWLYDAQGEGAKALLARSNGYQLQEFPIDIALVDNMLAFEAKPNKTAYEEELLGRLGASSNPRDYLLEVKGTGLLAKNLFVEAERVMSEISEPSMISDIGADPFRIVTRDVVNCEDCGPDSYTKLEFARRMIALEKAAATDKSKQAEYFMLLGNGHYATSYFGAAWAARDYNRSGGSWYSFGSDWGRDRMGGYGEYTEMSIAKSYYKRAMATTKDKEMGALAAFMVAKCELNELYLSPDQSGSAPMTGFAALKKEYRKTAAFKQLVEECLYLNAYVAN